MQNIRESEDGAILLVSLLLLAAIALSAIYLSIILLGEIRNTRYADNAIVAYYVAESGAEDALWRLKEARSQSSTFFSAHEGEQRCAAEGGADDQSCLGTSPSIGTDPERVFDFEILDTAAQGFIAYDIPRNSPIFVDVYDPADEEAGVISTNVSNVYVDWYQESCSGTEGSAKLEISYTPLSYNVSNELVLGEPFTVVDVCGCTVSSPEQQEPGVDYYRCDPAIAHSHQYNVNETEFYRISLRSADTNIKKVIVTVGDSGGADIDLPSQVEIQANGRYREAFASVNLRAAWRDALSGIFNYVLFSEESLIKDTQTETSSPFNSSCGFCSNSGSGNVVFCSNDSDCTGLNTCTILNTSSDIIDGSDSAAFCSDTTGSETYDVTGIDQTEQGSCNLYCNGLTRCGDGVIQSPNGAVQGGTDGSGTFDPLTQTGTGYEECDLGDGLNSDTLPNTCRTSCLNAYCGDGVVDNGEGCDDANADGTDQCDVTATNPQTAGECTPTFCGDEEIQYPNGAGIYEICDDGTSNGTSGLCASDCSGLAP